MEQKVWYIHSLVSTSTREFDLSKTQEAAFLQKNQSSVRPNGSDFNYSSHSIWNTYH